jgi:hypothetical protein
METWVDGNRLFDRGRPADRLAAEGGWGAGDDGLVHVHAELEGHN